MVQGAVRAMCLGISGAQGTHCTLCCLPSEASGEGGSVQVRTSPYKSVFPCPQYRPCTMRFASQRECAMFFGERTAHGARGETSLFPPCTPLSPRVLYRGLRHAMRLFKLPRSYRFPPRREAVRLKCSVPLGSPQYFGGCRCTACAAIPSLGPCALGTEGPRPVC